MNSLFKLAEGYSARSNADNAASICETVMDNEEAAFEDEEEELLDVGFDCVESAARAANEVW